MERKTLVERILITIKGGDEAKLQRFETKVGKFIDTCIRKSNEKIDSLNDKITDAKETLKDGILNVTPEKIQSTDSVEAYVVSYLKDIEAKMDSVEKLHTQIEEERQRIERWKEIQVTLYA